MKNVNAKTFIDALRNYQDGPKKMQKYFSDQRLTIAEKKILECWMLLGDNHFFKILSILDGLSTSYDPLVEAQKYLILGITLNNKSECQQAIPLILKSYEVIRTYPIPRHHFIAINNLFIAYLNYKDEKGMKYCLDEMKKMKLEGVRQKIMLLHARFNYLAFKGELQKAWTFLEEADQYRDEMTDVAAIGHFVNQYVYYVKAGEFEKCFEVLARMKKQRKFYHSENYNYMKMMLEHYLKNTPLYVYATDFEDHSTLYYQLRVIKFLEEDDREGALRSWKELQRVAPHIYKNEFSYQGDVSIFSLCLKKHLSGKSDHRIDFETMPAGKEERLSYILNKISSPIKKETLYEYIWGKAMQDKDDIVKLKKLISRLRVNGGVEISYRKGCYQLIQVGDKKDVA